MVETDTVRALSSNTADPSALTTAMLLREVSNLEEKINVRLEGMDKAMTIFSNNITRVPTDTDKQIGHLKELHDEKFNSIQIQFQERDRRSEQSAISAKVAVDAALQAAKELGNEQNKSAALAISKSEAATTKQIDQQGELLRNMEKALNERIDDLKNRLALSDAQLLGLARSGEGKSAGSDKTIAYVITAISTIISITTVIVLLTKTGGLS